MAVLSCHSAAAARASACMPCILHARNLAVFAVAVQVPHVIHYLACAWWLLCTGHAVRYGQQ
eukprot:8795683-Alexandrium_andersonii.AAC.1